MDELTWTEALVALRKQIFRRVVVVGVGTLKMDSCGAHCSVYTESGEVIHWQAWKDAGEVLTHWEY